MELTLPATTPVEYPLGMWNLQEQLLSIAEESLGPRDTRINIAAPAFSDDHPTILYNPVIQEARARLSPNGKTYWPTVVRELAHETVHLLNPKNGDGTWLSEGVAEAFSQYAQRRFNRDPQAITMPSYKRALELVSTLPPDPLTAGRRIRENCGSLDAATPADLVKLFPPNVSRDTLTQLCQPFDRAWAE